MRRNHRIAFAIGLSLALVAVAGAGLKLLSPNVQAASAPETKTRYERLAERNVGHEERAKRIGIEDNGAAIVRPANKELASVQNGLRIAKSSQLLDVEELPGVVKDSELKDGAAYTVKKLETYEEYVNSSPSADLDPGISKDRLVWVVAIHYPNGYQHKRGFVENALVESYYDAQTGELYGYSIQSLNPGGNGIAKPEK